VPRTTRQVKVAGQGTRRT